MEQPGMEQPSKRQRKSDGKYDPECQCSAHDADISCSTFYKLDRSDKKLRKSDIDFLLSQCYVKTSRYGKICANCVNSLLRSQSQPMKATEPCTSQAKVGQQTEELDIDGICSQISAVVKRDIATLYNKKRPTIDSLLTYSPREWLEARPQQLVKLVAGICGIDSTDESKSYLLAKAVEQIYFIRNHRLVLPLTFRESVLIYTWTKSRKAITLQCANTPSSSYMTINRFLDSEAAEEIKVPTGTVRCAFDNNQIIGKTHIITGSSNTVPTSIMTSTCYTQMNTSNLQQADELKPLHWMWRKETDEERQLLLGKNDSYIKFFRQSRNEHIRYYLNEVCKQQQELGDYVDLHIQEEEAAKNEKVCNTCGSANDKDYRICRNPGCGGPLSYPTKPDIKETASKAENATDPTKPVKNLIPVHSNEAKVIPGEPQFVNPNSYETIVKVMQTLGQHGGVDVYGGEDRKWMFLECDGLPYKIMRDIMDNTFICGRCNTSYYTAEVFNSEEHRCFTLHGEQPLVREFHWLVPIMGLLHFEMNACRAFIKLNWDVFVSVLAYAVGFETVKAQEYARRGSDHHKTWQLLQIMYIALTEELLVPYVREARDAKTTPSVQGYWDWCESNNDPNYAYMQQMVMTYLHSLMLLRIGVRHNNVDVIMASRRKCESLMYGQNHPKYQYILYRDMHDQVTMPPELQSTLYQTFTFSRTGNEGHYQGGDANLEEVNKDAKHNISNIGVPNERQWTTVFRNLEKMKAINEATMKDAGVTSSLSRSAQEISALAIGKARVTVRKAGYLMNPKAALPHMSLDGQTTLNPQLITFEDFAENNRLAYIEEQLEGKSIKLDTMAVTLTEAQEKLNITSKTKEEITIEILKCIDQLPIDVASAMEDDYKRNVKGKKKDVLVQFYYRLVEEMDDGPEQVDDNDDIPELENERNL